MIERSRKVHAVTFINDSKIRIGLFTPQFLFYAAIVGLMMAAVGIQESIFNNFLSDTFQMSPTARGALELPREAPGFLVVATTGVLAAVSVTGLGAVGAAVMGVGVMGLGLFGANWWAMMAMMVLASAGMHLIHPVTHSITIALSTRRTRGRNIGLVGSVGKIGMIAGAGGVWLFFDKTAPQYRGAFLVAGGIALAAAAGYAALHIPHLCQPRARMVFKRKFSLYYLLEFLFGARKQIFITFGPWVLIRVYGKTAGEMAFLFMIASVIGIIFKPLAGMVIDRFGERAVLVGDGLVLALVCLGYGFAGELTRNAEAATLLACGCFILDDLLFSLGTGRSIYAARMADTPQELTSTLSMGVSVNHIVSMTIPLVAGGVWEWINYQAVFVGAAALALVISACALRIPAPHIDLSTRAT